MSNSDSRCPYCGTAIPEGEPACVDCQTAAPDPSRIPTGDQPETSPPPASWIDQPAEPAAFDPASAPSIAGFEILGVLGEGGMGTVYEAEQRRPSRRVALKVIKAGAVSDHLLRRFAFEADALGRLQHRGIAQIFEVGSAGERGRAQPFFAMELVRGGDGVRAPVLTEYAQNRQLTARQRLELVAQVADAVHYAHQRGVIHRDLKPANILVDEGGQPKVLDFGVARLTDRDVRATTVETDIGQIVGTLPYMSPEQASGDPENIDTRCDIYALGVICYELLTGRLPLAVRGKPLVDAVSLIQNHEPPRLSSINRALRGDVETIVAKAMAKEKERRYLSAAEFAADIRRHLHDEPISARPSTVRYHLMKFARRNKALVSGAVAVLLVLVGGIITTGAQAARATRALGVARVNEKKADDRLTESRELALKLVSNVYDAFEFKGRTEARRELAEIAQQHLTAIHRDLDREGRIQPDLLRGLAEVWQKLGDVQGGPDNPSLGDMAAARESYEKAHQLWERLLRGNPNDPVALHGMGGIYYRMGQVQMFQDDARARLTLEKGLDFCERWGRMKPADPRVPQNLAVFNAALGQLDMLQNNLESAFRRFEQARELVSPLLAAGRGNTKLIGVAIKINLRLAELHLVRLKPDRSLQCSRQALNLADSTLAEEPDNPIHLAAKAIAHCWMGKAQGNPNYPNVGDPESALASYRQAGEIYSRLSADDPRSATWLQNLSMVSMHIGDLHASAGAVDEAKTRYDRSLRDMNALAEKDPNNTALIENLIALHTRLASVAMKQKKISEWLAESEKSEELSRLLNQLNPGHVHFLKAFIGGIDHVEEVEELKERIAASERHLQQAGDHPLLRGELNKSYWHLGVALMKLSEQQSEARQLSKALGSAEQALAAFERMAQPGGALDEGVLCRIWRLHAIIGDQYAMLSREPGLDSSAIRTRLENARDHCRIALKILTEVHDHRHDAEEAKMPEALRAAVERAEARLKELDAPATRPAK